jgi:hypothetical protein
LRRARQASAPTVTAAAACTSKTPTATA